MNEATLLSALGGVVALMMTALAVTVWYTITRGDKRQDAERGEREQALKDEREARERSASAATEMFLRLYKEERDARDSARERYEDSLSSARHDARDDLAVVAAKQAAFELYCAREYVSYPRLVEALRPLTEGQERIFERLDTKQDKLGSGH